MRGECKQPGGKLVAVSIAGDTCRLDGDFFVDARDDADVDAALRDVGAVLGTMAAETSDGGTPSVRRVARAVGEALERHPGVLLEGTGPGPIAVAFLRALGHDPDVPVPAAGRTGTDADGDRRRWESLAAGLSVVHDRPRTPAEQMALDVAWARQVADGRRGPTMRFWEWSAPAVVVGRFQSIDDEVDLRAAREAGLAVVRRCTGGGAMLVTPEGAITFSLIAPRPFVDGLDVAASHRLCEGWVVDALAGLGLDVRFSGLNDIASARGKIGGSAQRRFPPATPPGGTVAGPGAVLHHTTLAYDLDPGLMRRVLKVGREKMSDKAVRSASRRVDPLSRQTALSRRELVARLMDAVRAAGVRV